MVTLQENTVKFNNHLIYNLRCVYFCCFLIFKNWLFLKTPIFYYFFRKISSDDCLGSKKGHRKETPSFWGLIK